MLSNLALNVLHFVCYLAISRDSISHQTNYTKVPFVSLQGLGGWELKNPQLMQTGFLMYDVYVFFFCTLLGSSLATPQLSAILVMT